MDNSPDHRPARTRLLDAAVTVLARDGLRGLSHRRVEQEAGLTHGSTTYYFRTRDTLIRQVIAYLAERDQELVTATLGPSDAEGPPTAADVVRILELLLTSAREQTLARFELFLHAAREPELRGDLVRWRRPFRDAARALLAELGAPEADRAAESLVTGIDGLLFTAVCLPDRMPLDELRRQTERLLARHLPLPAGEGGPAAAVPAEDTP
ncbi:TetR family transcriptional regulator C-terminal domain-containing protein [Streptomyces sp. JJ66]|uniref:TetR/AcrR family transcriptional regulator n=1 Tax=Streptomyces sp. JJ66 TaxID=2803843 RepID=UPI001C569166|nr:TetR family transcriptional regulator C-terminal domain-containing protein [Streptomyces sp. JJ66]MBW1602237.1 TetR family transcriptional regulator C-terminal domain-containing protein [Streptomyces sp. JJ66]